MLQILLEFQTLEIEQITQITSFSEKNIYQYFAELKEEFQDLHGIIKRIFQRRNNDRRECLS